MRIDVSMVGFAPATLVFERNSDGIVECGIRINDTILEPAFDVDDINKPLVFYPSVYAQEQSIVHIDEMRQKDSMSVEAWVQINVVEGTLDTDMQIGVAWQYEHLGWIAAPVFVDGGEVVISIHELLKRINQV